MAAVSYYIRCFGLAVHPNLGYFPKGTDKAIGKKRHEVFLALE